MESPDTLRDAIIWFSEFEHCRQFMTELRWADGKVKCPHCNSEKVTYLAKQRVWKCYTGHDRPTFSLKTGTIFEDSPLGLDKWLPAEWLLRRLHGSCSTAFGLRCRMGTLTSLVAKSKWMKPSSAAKPAICTLTNARRRSPARAVKARRSLQRSWN